MNMQTKSKVVLRSSAGCSVDQAVHEAMEACDWRSLIGRNDRVVVKPNLCTPLPEWVEAANTSIEVCRAVCSLLLERTGNISLVESDGIRYTAQQAFEGSGYVALGRELGLPLVNLSRTVWTKVECAPVGEVEVPRMLLSADAFITLPVLKTHGLTYFTGALKNQWGCLPQFNRIMYHSWLDQMLASLHAIFRPKLAVMDGVVAMEGRGPVAGKPRRLDLILASRDGVALDASAMRLVGLSPERARHVVGTHFEPGSIDWANRIETRMSRYRWFVKYLLERDLIYEPIRSTVKLIRRFAA
jgi:uncharacterized protein (DUF362 family)